MLLVALVLAAPTFVFGAETVTVGGAVVPIAQGWKQTTAADGSIILMPPDLPKGTDCRFLLLGGEPMKG